MKTSLELPSDVAQTLPMESARRGGRKAASLSNLVTDAVRKVYGTKKPSSARSSLQPGRVIIGAAADAPQLTTERIHEVLSDDTK